MEIDYDSPMDEQIQTLAQELSYFMRGMHLDPRLPADMKEALLNKANEADEIIGEIGL